MTFIHSLVLIIIVTLVAFAIGSLVYEKYKRVWKLSLATIVSVFWGLVIAVLILDIIFYQPDTDKQIQGIVAGLAGASLGWLLGMWISPMGRTESTTFGKYWTAIGVGSGFSAKWVLDHITANKNFFFDHWFVTAIFITSCLVVAATVYNSRAYDASLDIYIRPDPGTTAPLITDTVKITVNKSLTFYADVCGASDSLSRWDVFPKDLGTFDPVSGIFTAGPKKMTGKITAQNIEDPTLSNYIDVEIIEAPPASKSTQQTP